LAGARVRRSRVKEILAPDGIGAGDDAPTRAVPLFDKGLKGAGGIINEVPHGPDVAGGDDGDSMKGVGYGAGIRTGDDTPTAAVPLLDHPSAALFRPPGPRRWPTQPLQLALCP